MVRKTAGEFNTPATNSQIIGFDSGNNSHNKNNFNSTEKLHQQQQKQIFINHILSGEASLAKEMLSSSNSSIQIDAVEASDLLLQCVRNIADLDEDHETFLLLIDVFHDIDEIIMILFFRLDWIGLYFIFFRSHDFLMPFKSTLT